MKKLILSVIFSCVFSLAFTAASDPYDNSVNSSSNQMQMVAEQNPGGPVNTVDKDIMDKVQKKIGAGWFSKGYEGVKYSVNNGVVTLTGSVATIDEKNKVEEKVKAIDGVKSVDNQITVTGKKL